MFEWIDACDDVEEDEPYIFKEKPVAKSGTSVLISTPGNIACPTCGCRDFRRSGCNCTKCEHKGE
jgi:hypothetical protein